VSYRNKVVLVSDIAGYSIRSPAAQAIAQERLLDVMTFACRHARVFGVPARNRQDRGDGRLYALPSRADEALMIPRLILGLRHGLYLANLGDTSSERLRIRVAMARGQVAPGALGFLGQPPITVGRLVDAPQTKAALAAKDDADLVVIVPDELYQDVLKLDFPGVPSAAFTSVLIAAKEYRGTAWIHVPPAGPVLPSEPGDALWAAVLGGGAAAVVIALPPSEPGDEDAEEVDWDELSQALWGASEWADPGDGQPAEDDDDDQHPAEHEHEHVDEDELDDLSDLP
jgi:hypothetical protein